MLYEYWCETCQKKHELLHSMKESRKNRSCPKCSTELLPMISMGTGGIVQKPPWEYREIVKNVKKSGNRLKKGAVVKDDRKNSPTYGQSVKAADLL